MKVRLLNNGGFTFLNRVDFPFEINAVNILGDGLAVEISTQDLLSVGATEEANQLNKWTFILSEFEVIE